MLVQMLDDRRSKRVSILEIRLRILASERDCRVIVSQFPCPLHACQQAIVRGGEETCPHELDVEQMDGTGVGLRLEPAGQQEGTQDVPRSVVRARYRIGVQSQFEERPACV